LIALARKIPPETAKRLAWATGSFAINQFLKLVNNVVLARLLAPSLFGLMLIVNSIRTGIELLSDVGINQNIVSNEQGHTPEFYDTAWTLRAGRGIVLGSLCFFLSGILAHFFGKPELKTVLPVVALMFVFTGFEATSSALLQKQKLVARVCAFDVTTTALTVIAHIILALITRTIWALVIGSVLSSVVLLLASYLLIPGVRQRIYIDQKSAREILSFGKWILLSSVVYFFAMNFDRLYFAKQIPLGELGVYSIARSLSDIISLLVINGCNMVVFPTVAAMRVGESQLRARLLPMRRTLLLLAALVLASFVAVADIIIKVLYDVRYADAAIYLPLLLIGVWLSILSTVNDSVMLGTKRPSYPALANAAKLATFVVGVPIAFHYSGIAAAILVLIVGETVRYIVLWSLARRARLGFIREDFALSLVFVLLILLMRELLWAAGLTGDIWSLFPFFKQLWVA
jgi:O-antigen/teichoic acid export membrane protein